MCFTSLLTSLVLRSPSPTTSRRPTLLARGFTKGPPTGRPRSRAPSSSRSPMAPTWRRASLAPCPTLLQGRLGSSRLVLDPLPMQG